MSHLTDDLKRFIDRSPTSWHAAQEIGNRLAMQDCIPLYEDEKWQLEPGQSYFVLRGGSVCAFTLPTSVPERVMIVASHTDSPALKIKPHPDIHKENMTLLGVEVYGGPLLTSWLNRDLGIAGRIVTSNAHGEIEEKLIFIDDAPLTIPQLAIHLDKDVNEKGLHLNKQDHLCPIATLENHEEGKYLETMLRRYFSFHTLLAYDLFLVSIDECRFLGSHGEMLAAPRLDNLCGAHACAAGFLMAQKPHGSSLQMAIFWDNEEIGSRTATGAASPFLEDILKRIAHAFQIDAEDFVRLKHQSLCVSVDMAHAFNPNYANKYDPNHQPILGKGVVIKYNADQKYASTAATAALIMQQLEKLNLKKQNYVTRSDLSCGSTVGPIMAHTLGIPVVDIGIPQLSMHSIREVIACQDHIDLCQLLCNLLQEG